MIFEVVVPIEGRPSEKAMTAMDVTTLIHRCLRDAGYENVTASVTKPTNTKE